MFDNIAEFVWCCAVLFSSVSFLLVVLACLGFVMAVSRASKQSVTTSYPTFLVVGDWGRGGEYNQSLVAEAMARKSKSAMPDWIVSVGDNFYEAGLTSVEDEAFDTSFKEIYHHDELKDVPWYAVLGNHDYGETPTPDIGPDNCPKHSDECFYSPIHQLDIRLQERDRRWNCKRYFQIKAAGGDVELFFIDTTPIVRYYSTVIWADNRGGVLEQSWEEQLRELDSNLSKSRASWKVVVGHHPIRTNHREKLEDMIKHVEPLMIKHKVSAYFCGHDHNMQHIHFGGENYHQITSGAGSQIGDGFNASADSPFQYAKNGFVAATMKKDSMLIEYIGIESEEPVFSIVVPKL